MYMCACELSIMLLAIASNVKVVHGRALFIGGEVMVTTPDQRPPSLIGPDCILQ